MRLKVIAVITVLSIMVFTMFACGYASGEGEDIFGDDGFLFEDEDFGNPNGEEQYPEVQNSEENQTEQSDNSDAISYDSYIVANTSNLKIRSGAGGSYSSVGTMDKGDMLAYLGKSGSWYKTVYKEKTAYVSTSYCSIKQIKKSNEKVESVVEVGKTLMGYPYVWGSQRYHWGNGVLNKSFKAGEFDCSALMQYIYYKGADVLLDVNTRTQVVQGIEIKKSDIKRGDLLFFTNSSRYYNKGIERIGHVAMYLGDNYILHTASDYAVIEQISTTRWNYYITAKRLIN